MDVQGLGTSLGPKANQSANTETKTNSYSSKRRARAGARQEDKWRNGSSNSRENGGRGEKQGRGGKEREGVEKNSNKKSGKQPVYISNILAIIMILNVFILMLTVFLIRGRSYFYASIMINLILLALQSTGVKMKMFY